MVVHPALDPALDLQLGQKEEAAHAPFLSHAGQQQQQDEEEEDFSGPYSFPCQHHQPHLLQHLECQQPVGFDPLQLQQLLSGVGGGQRGRGGKLYDHDYDACDDCDDCDQHHDHDWVDCAEWLSLGGGIGAGGGTGGGAGGFGPPLWSDPAGTNSTSIAAEEEGEGDDNDIEWI